MIYGDRYGCQKVTGDHAGMAELVDALDLKSRDHNDRGGSSPPLRTTSQESYNLSRIDFNSLKFFATASSH